MGDMRPVSDVTRLLRRIDDGDRTAERPLYDVVYEALRDMAGNAMRRQPAGHTLQPTALVNEAYLRLSDGPAEGWDGQVHFLKVAARAMRSVLVDHARRKGAEKRRVDGERVDIERVLTQVESHSVEMLALHEALEGLAEVDEPLARIFERRFFAGLTIEQTAKVLEVSTPTVERGWRSARGWMLVKLGL